MPPGNVKLVITDVDGVLTDGIIGLNDRGEEYKNFSVLDGLGVKLLQLAGISVSFLSSRRSSIVALRARDLGVRICLSGVSEKRTQLLEILRNADVAADKACYVGDDLVDIPCLKAVGFPVAVANARDEVKSVAEFVTKAQGGKGAFREVAEVILKARDQWEQVLERFQ